MAGSARSLASLNAALFAELDRLCADDLKGDDLKAEIERSKAVSGIARDVISNGRLILDAARHSEEGDIAKVTGDVCKRLVGGE